MLQHIQIYKTILHCNITVVVDEVIKMIVINESNHRRIIDEFTAIERFICCLKRISSIFRYFFKGQIYYRRSVFRHV